jgi:phosphoribosylformylglycinamidine (FGAM) synthase PurS component
MSKRAVAIGLKIPDNTAYTAAVALRRLGVGVERVERSEVWFFDDEGDLPALIDRIMADETIFNPNKHRVTVLGEPAPRSSEVWIEPLERVTLSLSKGDGEKAATAWRLFGRNDAAVDRETLRAAVEGLLCNPAIERAVY